LPGAHFVQRVGQIAGKKLAFPVALHPTDSPGPASMVAQPKRTLLEFCA
jgi:hypothetical protein